MYRCKITVLKRMLHEDLVHDYANISGEVVPCPRFSEGEEIIVERHYEPPEGFCMWAWADIRDDIKTIAAGGSPSLFKQPGTTLAGCTDWFRPVIFKIERLED
jgi:uncharacterized repeat protein (TIGR04076 family)